METYLRQFGSISDWLGYAESPCETPDSQRSTIHNVNMKSSLTDSNEEAFKLLRKGWPEGKEKMLSILNTIRNSIRLDCITHEFFPSVEGSAPNIEAYIQGIPEDMFHMEEIQVNAPPTFIQLQVDCGFPHNVTAEQMIWAGATLFASMEALRTQGCAVNLLLTHSVASSRSDAQYQTSVPVSNNIDIDTLSFLLTHPSTLRRIVFCIREHEPEDIRRRMGFYRGGGYGMTTTIKNPNSNICLSLAGLAYRFSSSPEFNLTTAQTILKNLIDTKYESHATL